MYNYEIRKLSSLFYDYYSSFKYPEILTNKLRNYDVVLFQIKTLKDCYICVPKS